jgi:hypothetical protein
MCRSGEKKKIVFGSSGVLNYVGNPFYSDLRTFFLGFLSKSLSDS